MKRMLDKIDELKVGDIAMIDGEKKYKIGSISSFEDDEDSLVNYYDMQSEHRPSSMYTYDNTVHVSTIIERTNKNDNIKILREE